MKDLLRSPAVGVATETERWRAPGARWLGRLRRLTGLVLAAVALYGSASLFSLLARSPYQVAEERACALGGWEADQVHFDEGRYHYRFLYSVVWAELLVDTPEGRRPVRIRLRNDPVTGWTVRSLAGQSVDAGVRLTRSF